MQLYSGPISLFTSKVRIALAEKGLDYERIEVGWSFEHAYEPHHPEVDRLNPKGQVPILVDDDLVICDSTQILEYLEDRHPAPALYPDTVAGRARCRRFEAQADEILFPEIWVLIEEGFYPEPATGCDPARRDTAIRNLAGLQSQLDAELAGADYLCESFGVADIANHVMCTAAALLGAPVDPALSNLAAWHARVQARDPVRIETGEMMDFLVRARAAQAS